MATAWRTSSRSGSNGGNCVQAATAGHRVAVRDSKNPTGPKLAVTERGWAAFRRCHQARPLRRVIRYDAVRGRGIPPASRDSITNRSRRSAGATGLTARLLVVAPA